MVNYVGWIIKDLKSKNPKSFSDMRELVMVIRNTERKCGERKKITLYEKGVN